jgi:DNA-binding response OmpR family regulator
MNENLKNFTLLYAEDDREIQKEMLEYFQSYFKEVLVADNGKDALDLYKKHKPDVLLLDIYMPYLSGLELAKKVRENDHTTKIVLVTAYSKDTIMLDAINININYYIVKPATLYKIKEMLHKISIDLERNSINIIRFSKDIYFNLSLKKLYHNDVEIKLSKKESDLLFLFIKNKDNTVTIEDIAAHCWSDLLNEVSVDSVKSLVSNLRKKLPQDTISNVYGIGYILKF